MRLRPYGHCPNSSVFLLEALTFTCMTQGRGEQTWQPATMPGDFRLSFTQGPLHTWQSFSEDFFITQGPWQILQSLSLLLSFILHGPLQTLQSLSLLLSFILQGPLHTLQSESLFFFFILQGPLHTVQSVSFFITQGPWQSLQSESLLTAATPGKKLFQEDFICNMDK